MTYLHLLTKYIFIVLNFSLSLLHQTITIKHTTMSCEICRPYGYLECPVCRPEKKEEEIEWHYYRDDVEMSKDDNWTVRENQFGNLEYR